MCGRYFLSLSPERLRQLFGTDNFVEYITSSQLTPLQSAPLVVQRRMGLGRWGLWPDYVQEEDKTLCAKLKNARSETITEKPTFSGLWQKGRRCLVPAEGFFEWPEEKIKGHPPYRITAQGNDCIAFAGLWTKRDDMVTFTILTRAASQCISGIHSRMPVAFRPDQAEAWFGSNAEQAYAMIKNDSITEWNADLQGSVPVSGMPDLFAA